MSWHKAGDYYSDLSTSHMMCSWRTAHQSLPNKLRTYNTISEWSGMVSLKITSATDWWTADIWGASREGNLAFALLRGSTPQAVLQAKIFLIHFKDDELTFYTEATLDNWELQSDKGKLTDILVRKPAWQWEEQEKKNIVNSNSSSFLPQFSYICAISQFLHSPQSNCHFTQLILHAAGKKSNKFDFGVFSS